MEKAKLLLSSANEDIPVQIHQDLASAHLELEANFTTVSQLCEEKSHSFIQAMEREKVFIQIKHVMIPLLNQIKSLFLTTLNWFFRFS